MTMIENPRAVAGDNLATVDYAAEETSRLKRDYPDFEQSVGDLLEEARKLPAKVDDPDQAADTGRVMKKLRDMRKRLEGLRELEKEPHLRRGQAVQGFFMTLMTKLARENKADKAGAVDVLQARIDDYTNRVLEQERQRRQRESDEAARIEREARAKADLELRQAEEARLAAERARKPETIEAKGAIATQAEETASAAQVEAVVAENRAVDAHVATLARPADMVRSRHDDVLLTGKREPYAVLTDRTLVDMNALRPYFTEAEIEKALRGWAKASGHKQQMPGAEVGHRTKGDVR